MLLQFIFLHKNKTIDTKQIELLLTKILKSNLKETEERKNNFIYNIKQTQKSSRVLVNITTKKRKSTLEEAQLICSLKNIIISGKHRKDYNIILAYDESSDYFCSKLSRFISVFERKLRQFIYLTVTFEYGNEWVSKTVDYELENSLKRQMANKNKYVEKALEYFSFNDYIYYLFEKKADLNSDIAVEKALKELLLPNPNINVAVEILKKTINRSLWEKLFERYSLEFSREDLNNIREIRNKVMHNKEINLNDFSENERLLKKSIKKIDTGILMITENMEYKEINIIDVFQPLKDSMDIIIKRSSDTDEYTLKNMKKYSKNITNILELFKNTQINSNLKLVIEYFNRLNEKGNLNNILDIREEYYKKNKNYFNCLNIFDTKTYRDYFHKATIQQLELLKKIDLKLEPYLKIMKNYNIDNIIKENSKNKTCNNKIVSENDHNNTLEENN